LWPTPTTQEIEHPEAELTKTGRRKSKDGKSSHSLNLADTVKMWPTPTHMNDSIYVDRSPNRHKRHSRGLASEVDHRNKMWPTPTVNDSKNNGGPSQHRRTTIALNAKVGGALNPQWVEWLMGYPIGWTDLKD
jgi:hypothetical protein